MDTTDINIAMMWCCHWYHWSIPILGPDIDTPEKEKNRLQELLSGLTLGSAHPPQSSAPIPAWRQMSDAGIQCDTQSATSSLSGSSTSNEMTGNMCLIMLSNENTTSSHSESNLGCTVYTKTYALQENR